MKLKTVFVYPPIPIRTCDWCAYPFDDPESRRYAWGRTEQEAINNWHEEYDDEIEQMIDYTLDQLDKEKK
jgi:hypothetical protein